MMTSLSWASNRTSPSPKIGLTCPHISVSGFPKKKLMKKTTKKKKGTHEEINKHERFYMKILTSKMHLHLLPLPSFPVGMEIQNAHNN